MTGTENWDIGSTFKALYSSAPNSGYTKKQISIREYIMQGDNEEDSHVNTWHLP